MFVAIFRVFYSLFFSVLQNTQSDLQEREWERDGGGGKWSWVHSRKTGIQCARFVRSWTDLKTNFSFCSVNAISKIMDSLIFTLWCETISISSSAWPSPCACYAARSSVLLLAFWIQCSGGIFARVPHMCQIIVWWLQFLQFYSITKTIHFH